MERMLKGLPAWAFIAGLAMLSLAVGAYAAGANAADKPESNSDTPSADANHAGKADSKPEAPAGDEAGKPEAAPLGKSEKSEEAAPKDESEEAAEAPGVAVKGGRKMQELLGEGFLIRTTVLIPAEVVTRQIGKVSPDAIVVTLQKETAITVCYYTLRAYVKLRLTDIPTCTVFR